MKQIFTFTLLFCSILALCSCQKKQNTTQKVKQVDYTVVTDADIPEELMKIIEERKDVPFQLTFSDQEFLYVVKGYGSQETGGYDIVVNDFYQNTDSLCLDTELFGPSADEVIDSRISYPYIVLKTELIDLPVEFIRN